MKLIHLAAALAGLAMAAALIAHFGAAAVGDAITTAGWYGLALVCLAHCASVLMRTLAWHVVLIPPLVAARTALLWARYVRNSLNDLIGIVPAAGEIAGARELIFRGARPVVAAASTIVDLTAELLSQVLFTTAGIAALVARGADSSVTHLLFAGLGLATAVIGGFFFAQRRGLFHIVERLAERFGYAEQWSNFCDEQKLHEAVECIYRQSWRLPLGIFLHLLAWGFSALETWLALRSMGWPVSFTDAVILESLVFAARTAAFLVPWAAGIQEGGFVMIGGLLGIPPGPALALSVLKRARELIFGAPGLLAWQFVESRRLSVARSRT